MAQVLKLSDHRPAPLDELAMLDILVDDYIDSFDIIATRSERDERYAALSRDCEARRNRGAFHVVS